MLIPLIITIIGVIYILSPIDIIPDIIPVIGWTDDALVIFIIVTSWAIYFLSPVIEGMTIGFTKLGQFFQNPIFLMIVLGLVGLAFYFSYLGKKNKPKVKEIIKENF